MRLYLRRRVTRGFTRVCALFGNCGTQHFISCQDGWRYIAAEVRGGEGIRQRSESMARQDGEEKKCVSGLIVPLMSLQAVTPLCGTAHYPSVRAR